jgi:hypothetical protein
VFPAPVTPSELVTAQLAHGASVAAFNTNYPFFVSIDLNVGVD